MKMAALSSRLGFQVEAVAEGSRARAARFRTLHNEVLTPLFMPVGTQATVKAQRTQTLEESGSQILLANTYHLLLRPGPEVFERLGGIHRFMSWPKSVLTDSGGFQIFSLPHSRSMSEEGAVFQSYLDGKTILLSPELSIGTQVAIGSDIMMALDQCIPSTANRKEARAALGITHRWAARSLAARGDSPQSMFGIVQGALFEDLRRESVEALTSMPFDGFAIGGLAVGESKNEREDVCGMTAELLPERLPRYLMGVGTPLDILEAVHRGVDMFDCIIPTQVAQRGGVFTSRGFLQLRRGVYKFSEEALDPDCECPTCARYSRAYLHHLTKTKETLGWQLVGQHNFYFYHRLMREMRASILAGRFLEFYHAKRVILQEDDLDNPVLVTKRKKEKSTTLGAYSVHTAREGFSSIVHVASGEIMHSRVSPIDESRSVYVGQARLGERLLEPGGEKPLVIWDVGLGAAANAMAAIECYEHTAAAHPTLSVRALRIVSFENDLDSLRLALSHNARFPYLHHPGPSCLLKMGHWHSKKYPGLSWDLVRGEFPESAEVGENLPPFPDVIFYDMFSSKTCESLWTLKHFERLFSLIGGDRGRDVSLFTYTTSTAARVAMLAAGFHLATGCSTGEKAETSIVMTPEAAASKFAGERMLNAQWMQRWERSSAKYPTDLPETEQSAFARRILDHAQFAKSASRGAMNLPP